ncbi:hypothetical protein QBC39DRAFT_335638 [Podospora conica]|nr:hypothetical protein QBC39DRAFT_335638 [Schizothecium conicum]
MEDNLEDYLLDRVLDIRCKRVSYRYPTGINGYPTGSIRYKYASYTIPTYLDRFTEKIAKHVRYINTVKVFNDFNSTLTKSILKLEYLTPEPRGRGHKIKGIRELPDNLNHLATSTVTSRSRLGSKYYLKYYNRVSYRPPNNRAKHQLQGINTHAIPYKRVSYRLPNNRAKCKRASYRLNTALSTSSKVQTGILPVLAIRSYSKKYYTAITYTSSYVAKYR